MLSSTIFPPNEVRAPLHKSLALFIEQSHINLLQDSDEHRRNTLATLRDTIKEYVRPVLDLSDFKEFYLTSGITDGLNYLAIENKLTEFLVSKGDYEYIKYIHNFGQNKINYVSSPSAINGNSSVKISTDLPCVVDCAYLGTTKPVQIYLPSNSTTVLLGLSKTFGLPDLRIGFVFSKTKLPVLDAVINKRLYFNMRHALLSIQLFKNFPLGFLHSAYSSSQQKICKTLDLTPSDVVFMATSKDIQYNDYNRGGTNRIGLRLSLDL